MQRQGKMNIVLTLAIISLTVILSMFTIQEFYATDFEPQFYVNEPNIILVDSLKLPQHEYVVPIQLSTMTSHSYEYTVSIVKDGIKMHDYGQCLFQEPPHLTSSRPAVFFLEDGGADKEIEPVFSLNYIDRLPDFSAKNMDNTIYHSIGTMRFEILAQDLQDMQKSAIIPVNADLTMRLPSDFDPVKICKNTTQ